MTTKDFLKKHTWCRSHNLESTKAKLDKEIEEHKKAKEELGKFIERQSVLAELNQLMLYDADISMMMNFVVGMVGKALSVEYCEILELLPDSSKLVLRSGVGWNEELIGVTSINADEGHAGFTLQSNDAVVLEDAHKEQRFKLSHLLLDREIISGICVIIPGRDVPVGVLGVHTTQLRHFTNDDIIFIQNVVTTLSVAIERKLTKVVLEESEKKYRVIIEHSNDMIWSLDTQGNFTFCNRPSEDLTGYNLDDWIGKRFVSLIREAELEKIQNVFKETMAGHPQQYEITITKKDGSDMILFVNTAPVFESGKVVGSINFGRDITEHKQAEDGIRKLNSELEQRVQERTAELEEKNKELLKLDKAKSDFLDTVSHELRTPLTSIIGYSKLLLDGIQGGMSEKQTQYIKRIWSRGNHQLRLVNDVLDFSKLQSERMAFTMGDVSVVEILSDTVADEMPSINQKGQEIILEVQDGVSDVHTDKMRLKQVLTNLINNAIKFTPDNGRIIIKADNVGKMVKISIIDNGIGIKEEDLGKIFDNFVQIDQSNSRSFGGTGLGLAIVRDLMKHMGGSIDVESEYDKGSTFSIFIPQEEPIKI